jgi:hypothetical protein
MVIPAKWVFRGLLAILGLLVLLALLEVLVIQALLDLMPRNLRSRM